MDIFNFLSYNTTGLDPAKINWINDLFETMNISCGQIQEHFKSIKTVNSYFAKNFSTFNAHVTPAVRENVSQSGRPKGGLCQFVSKDSKFKKEPIPCHNWRVQAQILHLDEYRLLWINVYMPTDPQTMQLDENEVISALNEIERLINSSSFHDVLIGGDINYDNSRISRF